SSPATAGGSFSDRAAPLATERGRSAVAAWARVSAPAGEVGALFVGGGGSLGAGGGPRGGGGTTGAGGPGGGRPGGPRGRGRGGDPGDGGGGSGAVAWGAKARVATRPPPARTAIPARAQGQGNDRPRGTRSVGGAAGAGDGGAAAGAASVGAVCRLRAVTAL